MESQPESMSAGSSRKSYPVSFKLSVVQFAEENSKNKAAEKFGVSRSRVQQWVSQKDHLLRLNPESKRIGGGGRKVKDDELDRQVLLFIEENRSKQVKVTRHMIRNFARSIGHHSFGASSGWLEKFLARHQLSKKREKVVCEKPPTEFDNSLVNFLLQIMKFPQQEES